MITKEQATAMADAITAPAAAERHRQIEARQLKMAGGTSAISHVPESERESTLAAARNYANRRWYIHVPAFLGAAWLIVWFLSSSGSGAALLQRPSGVQLLLLAFTTLGLKRLAVRTYVKRASEAYKASSATAGLTYNKSLQRAGER